MLLLKETLTATATATSFPTKGITLSPWQNVLPSLKDHLITEALCKGIRPMLDDVKNLYQTESIDAINLISFIHSAWSGEPSE